MGRRQAYGGGRKRVVYSGDCGNLNIGWKRGRGRVVF